MSATIILYWAPANLHPPMQGSFQTDWDTALSILGVSFNGGIFILPQTRHHKTCICRPWFTCTAHTISQERNAGQVSIHTSCIHHFKVLTSGPTPWEDASKMAQIQGDSAFNNFVLVAVHATNLMEVPIHQGRSAAGGSKKYWSGSSSHASRTNVSRTERGHLSTSKRHTTVLLPL